MPVAQNLQRAKGGKQHAKKPLKQKGISKTKQGIDTAAKMKVKIA
jgi:hypothetical protein